MTSHTPVKISIHILINIVSFPEEVLARMRRVHKSVPWDESVYSVFRSFRAINQSKGGRPYRLTPWGNSSKNTIDHIVRLLPGDTRPIITAQRSIHLKRPLYCENTTSNPGQPKSMKRRLVGEEPSESEDTAVRQEMAKVLSDTKLLKSVGGKSMDEVLGRAKKKGDFLFVYINNGYTCLFKKEPHKSNQAYAVMHADGTVIYRCLSPKCRGEKFVVRQGHTN